jgi:transcriptional regulator with XRE-family HTH domain
MPTRIGDVVIRATAAAIGISFPTLARLERGGPMHAATLLKLWAVAVGGQGTRLVGW